MLRTELSIPAFFGVLALLVVIGHAAGFAATKVKLPAVVGELAVGIAVAAIPSDKLHALRHDVLVNACGELGVLFLLFDIGLELKWGELRRIGMRALAVALVGVVASFALVGCASWALGAGPSLESHIFIGATLTATSIGITGRVLREFGRTQSGEGKLVLAAAVLDDVMSLVVLGFVTTWVSSRFGHASGESGADIFIVAARAFGFIAGALFVGRLILPKVFALLGRIADEGTLLIAALGVCFSYAWAANAAGLAPAIGAFMGGLVIQPEDVRPLAKGPGDTVEGAIAPLLGFFVPVFFVLAGFKVDASSFAQPRIWLVSLAFVAAAVGGKLAAGLAAGKSKSRFVVGVGLIPRGEVSLIFATAGVAMGTEASPLLGRGTFDALVVTVMATALIAPLALRWALSRER